jgi:hypothetical protein
MRLNDIHNKRHGKEFLLKDFWMSQKVNKKSRQWFHYLLPKLNKKREKGVSNVVINVLVLRTSLAFAR